MSFRVSRQPVEGDWYMEEKTSIENNLHPGVVDSVKLLHLPRKLQANQSF